MRARMSRTNDELIDLAKRAFTRGDVAGTTGVVPFDHGLQSELGGWFILLPLRGFHTTNDVITARAALRRERDIHSIEVVWVEVRA